MRALLLLALLAACAPAAEPDPPAEGPEAPPEDPAPPADTARLSIVVLEGDGTPLPESAFLRWRPRDGGELFADEEELAAVLLREGTLVETSSRLSLYEFDVPADQPVDLLAVAGDRRVHGRVPPLPAGAEQGKSLILPAPTRLLRGRLIDPEGAPVGGVHVSAAAAATVSRLDGTFEMTLAQAGDHVRLDVDGWPSADVTLPAGDERVDVTLPLGASLTLAFEGEPLLYTELSDAQGTRWRAMTDGTGRAVFHALPADTPLWLQVRRRTGVPGTFATSGQLVLIESTPMTFAAGEARERVVALPGPGPIAGRLVDQDGAPLEQVELCLAEPLRGEPVDATYLSHDHLPRARVVTDGEGRFRFDEVPGGVWLVGVSRGAWNSQSPNGRRVSYAALPATAGTKDMELQLAAGLKLRGHVDGLAGRTRVEARPQSFGGAREAFTKRDGTFVIDRLMPGPHDLYVDDQLVRVGVDPATPQVELRLDLDG